MFTGCAIVLRPSQDLFCTDRSAALPCSANSAVRLVQLQCIIPLLASARPVTQNLSRKTTSPYPTRILKLTIHSMGTHRIRRHTSRFSIPCNNFSRDQATCRINQTSHRTSGTPRGVSVTARILVIRPWTALLLRFTTQVYMYSPPSLIRHSRCQAWR